MVYHERASTKHIPQPRAAQLHDLAWKHRMRRPRAYFYCQRGAVRPVMTALNVLKDGVDNGMLVLTREITCPSEVDT